MQSQRQAQAVGLAAQTHPLLGVELGADYFARPHNRCTSAPFVKLESSAMRLYKDSLVGRIFSPRPLLVAAIGPG